VSTVMTVLADTTVTTTRQQLNYSIYADHYKSRSSSLTVQ